MVPMALIWWIYHFWVRFWPYFNFVDFRAYFSPFSLVKSAKTKIFPHTSIFSIKHDLARSCFQLWPKTSNESDKIMRKKTGKAIPETFFSSSEPILISPDYVLCYIPRAMAILRWKWKFKMALPLGIDIFTPLFFFCNWILHIWNGSY